MYKCKYIKPIQPHLQFGVDLKEIYPPWYLHPTLKNLMYLSQINIRNKNSTRFDLEEICGKSQADGTIKQRLKLKELITNGRNILNVKVAPGAPLWVLRHFLGLLPNPIFAPKTTNHWLVFATDCYQILIDCIRTKKNCSNLKFTIAFELAHLPDINLTLLFEFFDLLRFLSSKTSADSKESVDNHAALILVKYFIPCLFERPYTPGILKKIDKKYISMLLYVIHFWPELRTQIHDLLISSIDKNEAKFHYFSDKYANNNDYLKDIGVQTEEQLRDSQMSLNFTELSESNSERKLIDDLSKIEVIYEDCNLEILSPKSEECEIFSSTPYVKPNPSFASIKRNKCKKSDSSTNIKTKRVKVVSQKIRKTRRNSKNYEIIILELPYKVKRKKKQNIKITSLQTKMRDNTTKYETTKNNELLNNNETDDTFIGENHEDTKCFNLKKINKNPFISKIDTTSPTYIDFNSPTRSIDLNPPPNDLLERITKFGWSYTKSARRKLNLNDFDEIHTNDSLKPLTTQNPPTWSKNNILDNIKKIGSKLTAKVSCSCEDLRAKVKYKKLLKCSYSI